MMDMVSIINFLDHCHLIGQNDSGMVYNVYPSSLRPAKYYVLREHPAEEWQRMVTGNEGKTEQKIV